MLICGQESNFSALNANDIERMDTAQQHMTAASAAEAEREKTGYADALRGQCRLVMAYLDELLGEGAAARLGLDGSDFNDCIRVTEEFKQAIQAEQNRVYSPGIAPKKAAAYPAAKTAAQADRETRRKQLLRELAELENG